MYSFGISYHSKLEQQFLKHFNFCSPRFFNHICSVRNPTHVWQNNNNQISLTAFSSWYEVFPPTGAENYDRCPNIIFLSIFLGILMPSYTAMLLVSYSVLEVVGVALTKLAHCLLQPWGNLSVLIAVCKPCCWPMAGHALSCHWLGPLVGDWHQLRWKIYCFCWF